MSPQHRPFFFSNFLAAFRAQQAAQKVVTSPATSSTTANISYSTVATTQASHITSSTATQQPTTTAAVRTLTTKSNQPAAPQYGPHPQPTQTQSTSTSSTAVAIQTSSGTFQPARHHSTSPQYSRSPSPGYASPTGGGAFNRGRRGSDSSNEGGFKDVMGAEKWYIGGRTAAGEERFYKLSMVKRPRSLDRVSLDRMSL